MALARASWRRALVMAEPSPAPRPGIARGSRRLSPAPRATSASASTNTSSPTRTARVPGSSDATATATFPGSVHGVVVHTSSFSWRRPATPVSCGPDRRSYTRRHVLVAERDLVGGERGLAARAVGDDLVALVQQPPLVDLRERPPHGLDVALIQSAVGVFRSSQKPIRSVSRFHSSRNVNTDSRQRALNSLDAVLLDLRLRARCRAPLRRRSPPAARGSPSRPCARRGGRASS